MKKNNLNQNPDKCNQHNNCKCEKNSCDCCENESVTSCQCESEALKIENEKLKNDLLRSFADMENLKKRTEADIQNNRDYVTSNIIKSFVHVADNLSRAISAYENNASDIKSLIDGIKMTESDFMRVLNGFGVEKIKTVSEIFNPELHQAVSMKAPEKDEDIDKIAEEIQVGYTLNGKVIKPSLVVVYKK